MSTYDDNLTSYKNTIGKLVNGELSVLTDQEQGHWESLFKDSFVDDEKKLFIEEQLREAFSSVMGRAADAIGRALGDDKIWIARAMSMLMSLMVLENHPRLALYVNFIGYVDITQGHLPKPHPEIVEHVLTIQAVLSFFLYENDCPAKRIAIRALIAAGSPIELYGTGQNGPGTFDDLIFARIPTKWGFIQVRKEKK